MKKSHWIFFCFLFSFNNTFLSQVYLEIDTTNFAAFHKYESNSLSNVSFGSAGSIFRSLVFSNSHNLLSQSVFLKEEVEDLPSFDVKTPIVDTKYITGSGNEQLFSVFHSQNITPLINYSILYTKKSFDGYYLNQGTNHNFFQSNFSFTSKDKRYNAKLLYKHHRCFHYQNGGIIDDSLFTDDQYSSRNRLLLDVNLENAFSRDAFNKLGLFQEFLISSKFDSLENKATSTIGFDLSVSSQKRTYFDSLVDQFYLYNLLDTVSTRDSLTKKHLNSLVQYQILKEIDSSKTFLFTVGIDGQLYTHSNLSIDTNFYNSSGFFAINFTGENHKIGLNANYFVSGYRVGDFTISTDFFKKYNDFNLSLQAKYSSISPSYELINYSGNHGYWNNSFANQKVLFSKGSLTYKGWKLFSQFTDVENPIYFDYFGVPNQEDGYSQVIQTSLSKEFSLRAFQLNTSCFYQYQGGYTIYQLPEWVGIFDLSYSFDAFKSALQLNIGIQGMVFSEYYLMNYRPDFGVFYVSNEKKQENYLYADFYLNAKIKTVNFFFLVSHLNSGLMGYNYFSALHYPSPDRYFKLGLRWMFLN